MLESSEYTKALFDHVSIGHIQTNRNNVRQIIKYTASYYTCYRSKVIEFV
jgi:hypothetical protein